MFNSIQSELKEIFINLEKDYSTKSGHLSKYIPGYEVSKIDQVIRPALVILSAKLFHGYDRRSMVMAEVIQLIHLAQDIHNHITDDCPKETPQFPVLVGDYLFSKFFKKLSDHDLLEWLAPLATVICKMNEGGIIRREIIEQGQAREKDYLQVLFMEYGLLMGMACKIGGNLAGCSAEEADNLEQFGNNLGMAWGVIKENYPLAAGNFLDMSRNSLMKIPLAAEREEIIMTGDGSPSRYFRKER
ncbi:MAG: polyprenyl synthetase family protein [Dehalobacterium sp.]